MDDSKQVMALHGVDTLGILAGMRADALHVRTRGGDANEASSTVIGPS